MSWSHIRLHYGVCAMRGVRVTYQGKPGTITGTSRNNLMIWLDEQRDKYAKAKGYRNHNRRYRTIVHPMDSHLVYLPTAQQVADCDKWRRRAWNEFVVFMAQTVVK